MLPNIPAPRTVLTYFLDRHNRVLATVEAQPGQYLALPRPTETIYFNDGSASLAKRVTSLDHTLHADRHEVVVHLEEM